MAWGRCCVAAQVALVTMVCLVSSTVNVGDQVLSAQSWAGFTEALNCWTSPEGNWTRRPDIPPLYSEVSSNDIHLVTKIYSACGPLENRTGLDYEWTPPSRCAVPMFNFTAAAMCNVMRGRHLIFTGDSLSLHTYETMVNAMGNRTVFGRQYDHHDPHHWAQPYDCAFAGAGLNFSIIYLSWNSIGDRHHIQSLERLAAEGPGAVLVANWGAFVQPDGVVQHHMEDILRQIDRIPNLTFIFRASNMAHLNCEQYRVPDNVLHQPAPHPWHPRFKWDVFPKQGRIWSEYLRAHEPGKIFLDVLPLSSKRPDQHPGEGDCLHYCIRGPIDTWAKLVFSALQLIETLAEEDRDSGVIPSLTPGAMNNKAVTDLHKRVVELEHKLGMLRAALGEEKNRNSVMMRHPACAALTGR